MCQHGTFYKTRIYRNTYIKIVHSLFNYMSISYSTNAIGNSCQSSTSTLKVEYICNHNITTPVPTVTSSYDVTNAGNGTYIVDVCTLPQTATVTTDGVSMVVNLTSANQTVSLLCNGGYKLANQTYAIGAS